MPDGGQNRRKDLCKKETDVKGGKMMFCLFSVREGGGTKETYNS